MNDEQIEWIEKLNKLKRYDLEAVGTGYMQDNRLVEHAYGEYIRAEDIAAAFGLTLDSCYSGFAERTP